MDDERKARKGIHGNIGIEGDGIDGNTKPAKKSISGSIKRGKKRIPGNTDSRQKDIDGNIDEEDVTDSGNICGDDAEPATTGLKKKRKHDWVANPQKNFGQENVKKGDNSRYLRHALEIFNQPPIDISDDQQVAARLDWYFANCIENDMKPTVSGMSGALGIGRDTLWMWYRGKSRAETHSNLIKKYYNMLESLWEDYMMNGKVNPASGIFLGRNHWGYQDQVEVVLSPKNPLGDAPDQKALESKLEGVVVEEEEV